MKARIVVPLAALIALFTLVWVTGCEDAPPSVREISQDELLDSPPPGALILDVRTTEEFERGHVPNAIHIPHDELASRVTELGADPDAPIVVYCESGRRAATAGATLLGAGRTNVLHLEGDMRAWRELNRPLGQ
jgi:phage shock protein E